LESVKLCSGDNRTPEGLIRLPPILIRPQDATARLVNDLAEEIIQRSLSVEYLDVVGIGSAISHTCSVVGVATSIAKIYVKKLLLDYVETPVVGPFETIYFSLTTKSSTEHEEKVAKLEAELVQNRPGPGGQLVLVSKLAEVRRITTTCLYKMREFELLKIEAAGSAIGSAASAALQVVRLSKESARIEAVGLETIQSKVTGRPSSALSIYIRRGKQLERDPDFQRTMRDLKLSN
jgi:hypothetical protein